MNEMMQDKLEAEIKRLEYAVDYWEASCFDADARASGYAKEVEMLKEEVREQKELVQMILAEGYKTRQRLLHKHGVEIIVHESKEVQGE